MRLRLPAFLLLLMTSHALATQDPIYVVRPPGMIAKAGAVIPQNAFGTSAPTAPSGGTAVPQHGAAVYVDPQYGLGSENRSATVRLGAGHVISISNASHLCFANGDNRPEGRAAFDEYWDETTQRLTITPKIVGEMKIRVICEWRNPVSSNGYNLDLKVVP
jgi:hypothetical protein